MYNAALINDPSETRGLRGVRTAASLLFDLETCTACRRASS